MIIVPPTLYSEIEKIIDVCASVDARIADSDYVNDFCATAVGALLMAYNKDLGVDSAFRGNDGGVYITLDESSTNAGDQHKVVSHVDDIIAIG